MNEQSLILKELEQATDVLKDFKNATQQLKSVELVAQAMYESIKNGGKIISCGNGGSHCDAMHFAEELTGMYREQRKAIAALCISDSSHITCVGNDFGYENIFSRYIEALGKKGDVLLAISTSGNSKNILLATEMAKKIGITVVALTGNDGGLLASKSDMEIRVPHSGYSDRIQEIHIKIIHILIMLIEKKLS